MWDIKNTVSVREINYFLIFILLIHSGITAATVYIHYFNTSLFFLSYCAMFLLALPNMKRLQAKLLIPILVLLMLIWAVLSIFWSTYAYLTLLGSVSLLGMLLISYYMFDQYTIEEVLDFLVPVGFISLFLNLIAMLCFLDSALYEYLAPTGRWKALFGNPNTLGIYFYLFSVVFSLALYFKRPFKKQYLYSALFLSIIFLWQSKSITSWIAMAVFLGLFGLKWLNIKKNISWYLIFGSLFILACVAIFYVVQLLALFDRDLTFSTRTYIWAEVWGMMQNDMLIGKGYLGFWYDNAHKISLGPVFFSSHSGYLEIIVYFGVIGLLLFFMMLSQALFFSAKLFFSKQMKVQNIFPFIFIITYSLQNLMESSFFVPRSLLWILFIYFIIYVNNNHSRKKSCQTL